MNRGLEVILAVLTLTLVGSRQAEGVAQPSVATDRGDYSPGSIVSISGTGFRPGEPIQLQVLRIDIPDNEEPEHRPWQAKADEHGDIKATWLVTPNEAGATLRLTATGLASARVAQIIFTDAAISAATGGGAIPADTVGGSYTALTGPVITETVIADINLGTLVLTTPAGFVFDTNPPLPFITLSGDNSTKNINNLTNGAIIPLTVTTNSVSFTVASKSKGQTKNTLTYSNLRVRPTAVTPLSSGNITNTGTSTFPNSTTNFGTLTEVAGAPRRLTVSGFPSPQTAGVASNVTVTVQDQFGNPSASYAGTIHLTSTDAQATLPADYTFVSGDNGTHTFSGGAALKTAGTQSITASNLAPASFTGTQSAILVNPAAAARLVFATEPGSAVYGSLLGPQPVIVSHDLYGNNSSLGLGVSKMASLSLSSGTGQLLGTTSLDIGTGAGNGTVTFTNIAVNAVGGGKQLTASASGLSNAVSGSFTITQATVTASVTVSNKVYDGATSASIATRALSGVVGGDNVTLAGGTATFATKAAANGKTVTVTGLGLSGTAAGNYTLASTTATTSANITPASLTVTATAIGKVYDGTTAASVTLSDNRLSGDSLTTSYTTAVFTYKNAGTNKTVNVSGISVAGADAANYTANTTATATANISAASLTGTAGSQARLYGEANAPFTIIYTGFVSGENSNILTGVLSFSTTANTNSPVGSYLITPSGQSAPNYNLQYVAGTLTIGPASLMAVANNASRLYGLSNPNFTANIWGFVNGENTNVLGGTLALNTTAQPSSLPGNYPIVPSGLVSTNYSITFSNGTLTVTTTNQPPVVASITNVTIRPEQMLCFKVYASDPHGEQLTYSLDPGAPAGAVVTSCGTNEVFYWEPTRAQASTTNVITLRVTNNGQPPLSTAQTFTVIVLDYLEISVTSTNVERYYSVTTPIYLASSDGVTNLQFDIAWPNLYLSNASVVATAPEIAAATAQEQGTNVVITVQTSPGRVLQGTNEIALLSFTAISNQHSAFIPLRLGGASANKPSGGTYTNFIMDPARVAVVETEPLLWAFLSGGTAHNLILYGKLGFNYQLQYTTDLTPPPVWVLEWSYLQTNGAIVIGVDSLHPNIFYRTFQP